MRVQSLYAGSGERRAENIRDRVRERTIRRLSCGERLDVPDLSFVLALVLDVLEKVSDGHTGRRS